MQPTALAFSASYDTLTKIITAAILALLIAIAVFIQTALGALPLTLIAIAFLYSPRSYVIGDQAILVNRPGLNATIPLGNLQEVRRATKDDFQWCVRLWGSGGCFGYYGLFRSSALGRHTWYVTNRANSVIVRTDSRTTVFSPDDVDPFIAAIQAASPEGVVRLGQTR